MTSSLVSVRSPSLLRSDLNRTVVAFAVTNPAVPFNSGSHPAIRSFPQHEVRPRSYVLLHVHDLPLHGVNVRLGAETLVDGRARDSREGQRDDEFQDGEASSAACQSFHAYPVEVSTSHGAFTFTRPALLTDIVILFPKLSAR